MKPLICLVLLALVGGCDPDGAFVVFTDPRPHTDTDSGAPVAPVDEDAGAAQDTGAGGSSGEEDAGERIATGGRMATGSGGRKPVSSGGSPVVGAGGAVVVDDAGPAPDACPVVTTHTSGIGLTWQDCAPLGTYNKEQAMRACATSGAPECRATNCGVGDLVVCGYNAAYVYGCWGYAGKLAGYAKERSDSCSGFNWTWG